MSSLGRWFVASGGAAPPPGTWPPPPRAPLPAFPSPSSTQPSNFYASCWTYDAYPITPSPLPMVIDPATLRGNVMGVRVPGKLYVPGEVLADPSFLVTWFIYEQSRSEQVRILDFYRNVCGYYTIDFHLAAWEGRLVDEGVPGCSRTEALRQVAQARAMGCDVMVNLAVDNGAPDRAYITKWIDDLVAAGMNLACPAWQIDQRIPVPMELCEYLAWVVPYLRSKGVNVVMTHWVLHGCAVYDADTCAEYGVCDRFTFQRWYAGLGGTHVGEQFDVDSPILDTRPHEGGILGEANDMLRSFDGTDLRLVIAEDDMQAEFNQPYQRLELYGDLKGRSMMTATWTAPGGRVYVPSGGYLNGGRHTNGLVL